ncbi:MAG: hypothetical protein Q9225_005713 [Loekoesia sp. 1 TL-2023]
MVFGQYLLRRISNLSVEDQRADLRKRALDLIDRKIVEDADSFLIASGIRDHLSHISNSEDLRTWDRSLLHESYEAHALIFKDTTTSNNTVLKRIHAADSKVQRYWQCGLYEILPIEYYETDRPISREIAEGIAKLAQRYGKEETAEALVSSIRSRGDLKVLSPRDCTAAASKLKQKNYRDPPSALNTYLMASVGQTTGKVEFAPARPSIEEQPSNPETQCNPIEKRPSLKESSTAEHPAAKKHKCDIWTSEQALAQASQASTTPITAPKAITQRTSSRIKRATLNPNASYKPPGARHTGWAGNHAEAVIDNGLDNKEDGSSVLFQPDDESTRLAPTSECSRSVEKDRHQVTALPDFDSFNLSPVPSALSKSSDAFPSTLLHEQSTPRQRELDQLTAEEGRNNQIDTRDELNSRGDRDIGLSGEESDDPLEVNEFGGFASDNTSVAHECENEEDNTQAAGLAFSEISGARLKRLAPSLLYERATDAGVQALANNERLSSSLINEVLARITTSRSDLITADSNEVAKFDPGSEWFSATRTSECVQQLDAVNCGVYLLANASAIAADQPVPLEVDLPSLRESYCTLLASPLASATPPLSGIISRPDPSALEGEITRYTANLERYLQAHSAQLLNAWSNYTSASSVCDRTRDKLGAAALPNSRVSLPAEPPATDRLGQLVEKQDVDDGLLDNAIKDYKTAQKARDVAQKEYLKLKTAEEEDRQTIGKAVDFIEYLHRE